MILILEDNDHKAVNIIMRMDLAQQCIFIARSVKDAQKWITDNTGPFTCYLDYELNPGCGNGMEFLEWVVSRFRHDIQKLYITSYSPEQSEAMLEYCKTYDVPHEKWK